MTENTIDEKVSSFIRSRALKYCPKIKKIKTFDYHAVRNDYFNIYFFYINSSKKPVLEVKTACLDFGKEYLRTEFDNYALLRKLSDFPQDSIQSPLEIFEIENCMGIALTYMSGNGVKELTDSVLSDSIIPWLVSFHKSSRRETGNAGELIKNMVEYHELFFQVEPKARNYVEKMADYFSRHHECPTYFKHDDFNLENLLINGKKLRVKNFYYPMFEKLPMGELFFLYDRYYKRKKGRSLERVFSFFGNSSSNTFSIDRRFLELVDPYINALEINRASVNYLYFMHWIDYSNNVCSELIRMTPEYHPILSESPNFTQREKLEFWNKMASLHPGALSMAGATPAIIKLFFKN